MTLNIFLHCYMARLLYLWIVKKVTHPPTHPPTHPLLPTLTVAHSNRLILLTHPTPFLQ